MTLYIDDLRNPKNNFDVITRSSKETINYMTLNGCPEYISFDHDLGGDDTAIKIINFMIEYDLDNPGFIPSNFRFNVHSANPVGASNITSKLESYLNFKKLSSS